MAIEAKLFSRRGAEAQIYKGAETQTRKVQNLRPFFLDGNRSKIIFSQRRRGAEAQSYKGAEAQTRKVQNLLPFKKNTLEKKIELRIFF